jgi:hypothetical protein
MTTTLILMTLLIYKHFIFDFLYQPPYQWQNKGTYAHPGGIFHAGQHGACSFFILLAFTNAWTAIALAIFEFIVHYHIDWAKMNINRKMGWRAEKDSQFWILLGADQLLHYLTYVVLVAGALTNAN